MLVSWDADSKINGQCAPTNHITVRKVGERTKMWDRKELRGLILRNCEINLIDVLF